MKKIIIVLITLFAIGGLQAQSGAPQKATGYTKDGTLFYQVKGCQPLTQLEFYDLPSGGKLVGTATTDNEGNALVEVPSKGQYAFALNRISVTKGGHAGTAYYVALGSPVLHLTSVTASNGELQWQVRAQSAGVTCEVYGSEDGAPFVKLASLPQKQGLSIGHYDADNGTAASQTVYSVQVVDATNQLSINLGKKAWVKPTTAAVKISPTVFTDVLNVQLLKAQTGTLQVFNGSGALVYSSVVKQGHNAIDLTKIAPANYIIKVNDRNNTTVFAGRVIKSQ